MHIDSFSNGLVAYSQPRPPLPPSFRRALPLAQSSSCLVCHHPDALKQPQLCPRPPNNPPLVHGPLAAVHAAPYPPQPAIGVHLDPVYEREPRLGRAPRAWWRRGRGRGAGTRRRGGRRREGVVGGQERGEVERDGAPRGQEGV